jgi:hypothetical protein
MRHAKIEINKSFLEAYFPDDVSYWLDVMKKSLVDREFAARPLGFPTFLPRLGKSTSPPRRRKRDRSGAPPELEFWKGWASPLYAAGGQIFILRHAHLGHTRRERRSPLCGQCGFPLFRLPLGFARGFGKTGQALPKDAHGWTPGDYVAVRTPCVAGGGVDKHGVLRLHFVIGSANNKVPLRMTGLKRVPISQRADARRERQSLLCDQCGSHPFDSAQGRLLRKGRARNGAPPAGLIPPKS